MGPTRALLPHRSQHPSPGGQYSFRILGPCCRLFDREELPWPCCRLQWRSKEPSWRRIGRRFVPDLACKRSPSYAVELLQHDLRPTRAVLTLFAERLSPELQEWWYGRGSLHPPDGGVHPPTPGERHQRGPMADRLVNHGASPVRGQGFNSGGPDQVDQNRFPG